MKADEKPAITPTQRTEEILSKALGRRPNSSEVLKNLFGFHRLQRELVIGQIEIATGIEIGKTREMTVGDLLQVVREEERQLQFASEIQRASVLNWKT